MNTWVSDWTYKRACSLLICNTCQDACQDVKMHLLPRCCSDTVFLLFCNNLYSPLIFLFWLTEMSSVLLARSRWSWDDSSWSSVVLTRPCTWPSKMPVLIKGLIGVNRWHSEFYRKHLCAVKKALWRSAVCRVCEHHKKITCGLQASCNTHFS